MNKVTISEAQKNLSSLLEQLAPGEALLIIADNQPIARLTREKSTMNACRAGSAKAKDHWMADDFDAPLDDFAEYME
jgi:antitoxin (DNA-binding transcriptional repressor) of toxin-antitoxin stability system